MHLELLQLPETLHLPPENFLVKPALFVLTEYSYPLCSTYEHYTLKKLHTELWCQAKSHTALTPYHCAAHKREATLSMAKLWGWILRTIQHGRRIEPPRMCVSWPACGTCCRVSMLHVTEGANCEENSHIAWLQK